MHLQSTCYFYFFLVKECRQVIYATNYSNKPEKCAKVAENLYACLQSYHLKCWEKLQKRKYVAGAFFLAISWYLRIYTMLSRHHGCQHCFLLYVVFINDFFLISTSWSNIHKKTGSNGWLSASLQYLQCISTGDTAVLHWAIDMGYQVIFFPKADIIFMKIRPNANRVKQTCRHFC